jgi:hypothetical protein
LDRNLSAEDQIGEEVSNSLKRMLTTMKSEVEKSAQNVELARKI